MLRAGRGAAGLRSETIEPAATLKISGDREGGCARAVEQATGGPWQSFVPTVGLHLGSSEALRWYEALALGTKTLPTGHPFASVKPLEVISRPIPERLARQLLARQETILAIRNGTERPPQCNR